MKLLKASLGAAVVAIAFLASCSKGSTGATGPAGPAGPDSVYHSGWTVLDFTGSTDQSGDSLYGQVINCAQLTQVILDSGMVVSYIGEAGPGSTGEVTDVVPTASFPVFEDYEVGSIYYYTYSTSDGGFGTMFNNSYYALRFVIIPGSVLVSTDAFKGLSKAQIATMSYDKLTSALGNKATVVTN
jgi:hypothetical protein